MGGSGIEKVVFDYILKNVKLGSTVVELGAGLVSTQVLGQYYKRYSVEQSEDYCDVYQNVRYIYIQESKMRGMM